MKTNRLIDRQGATLLGVPARVQLEAQITDAMQPDIGPVTLPPGWKFEDYSNGSPWHKYLFDYLGSLEGKTILDLGCGYHPTSIFFALAGAKKVHATDVSSNALAYIQKWAKRFSVGDRVVTANCPAEHLPFDDETFDLIHGEAVLHHLALPQAGPELARVLKTGGRAGFKDPLGQNPLLELARDYLPYPGKHEQKGTDKPLTYADIRTLGKFFDSYAYQAFGFSSMLAVPIYGQRDSNFERVLNRVDCVLLRLVPFLQRYCRFVVTCVQK